MWEKLKIWWPLTPSQTQIGKIWNSENYQFWDPPFLGKKISVKHLELLKNDSKTNLFFVQLKHLKSTFTFGKNLKIQTPPPHHLKKSNFCIGDFLIVLSLPFFHFLWYFLRLPLLAFSLHSLFIIWLLACMLACFFAYLFPCLLSNLLSCLLAFLLTCYLRKRQKQKRNKIVVQMVVANVVAKWRPERPPTATLPLVPIYTNTYIQKSDL